MSESAALEYGFPSTHSTNAVSVATYILLTIQSSPSSVQGNTRLLLSALACAYASSIVLGRLYCGMHGFFDVVIGSLLGILVSILECNCAPRIDASMYSGTSTALTVVVLTILVLVRIHPEPADDCPCFDDSVAFAGVMCGVEVGSWHFAQTRFSWDDPVPATVPFDFTTLGWVTTLLRILLGVLCIFIWRGSMKRTLLATLPSLFRVIEQLGLSLPRRFFIPATQYKNIPQHHKTDDVLPPASEILPKVLSRMLHPRRSRRISVGPQSAADAYETIASREHTRRNSIQGVAPSPSLRARAAIGRDRSLLSLDNLPSPLANGSPAPLGSPLRQSSSYMTPNDSEPFPDSPFLHPNGDSLGPPVLERSASQNRRQEEEDDREIFSQLPKPRVRYDVEVVTKLVVYSGRSNALILLDPK
ncbi:hypothetical protein MMC25_005490 [Agyrium rufum]|nr:hypothetical protein [Agyrium rufum]